MTQLRFLALAAVLVLLAGTANAAFLSVQGRQDSAAAGVGTSTWEVVYNPDGAPGDQLGSLDAKLWATGPDVIDIDGTDNIEATLDISTFAVFHAPSLASECPGVSPDGCVNYGGLNFGGNTAVPSPIVIGTFTVTYDAPLPGGLANNVVLEVVPGSILFGNSDGDIPDTTNQVLNTVPAGTGGVPEPAQFVLLGLGLAMLATVMRPPVAQA